MKYAIISDIHSNIQALRAVIEDIRFLDVNDMIVNLGDIVGYGAHPNECVGMVRNMARINIMGNHDYAVCDFMNYSFFNPYAKDAVEFTKKTLNDENLDFLKDLKICKQVGDSLFVHSSPIFPENWSYILNKETAEFIFVTMDTEVNTVFVGHSHVPLVYLNNEEGIEKLYEQYVYLGNSKAIVNVGSVGQPRDGDSRACYAIYDDEERVVRFRRIKYDVDAAFEDILDAGLPAILAERLKRGK